MNERRWCTEDACSFFPTSDLGLGLGLDLDLGLGSWFLFPSPDSLRNLGQESSGNWTFPLRTLYYGTNRTSSWAVLGPQ